MKREAVGGSVQGADLRQVDGLPLTDSREAPSNPLFQCLDVAEKGYVERDALIASSGARALEIALERNEGLVVLDMTLCLVEPAEKHALADLSERAQFVHGRKLDLLIE